MNAHTITLGNVTNAAAGPGNYNQTNGTINSDAISAWMGSRFNQFGGVTTIPGSLSLGGGAVVTNVAHYTIADGSLTAGIIELQRGDFNQTGGSVTVTGLSEWSSLNLGAATYSLSAGTLHLLSGITIPSASYGAQNPGGFMGFDATLLQTGGTNLCDGPLVVYTEYGFPGVPVSGRGPGRYVLSNGVLWASSVVRAWTGSDFQQWGGWHTNAGTEVRGETYPNWEVRPGSFTLGGGTLITPAISIRLGDFAQSGGTNHVGVDVGVGPAGTPASYTMSGGLLTDVDTIIDASNPGTPGNQPGWFIQTGGTHTITNLLRITGLAPSLYYSVRFKPYYVLSEGDLSVPNIKIENGGFFRHEGGTLTTSGLLNLGWAAWNENTSSQQFGQLLLSAPAGSNATLSLPPGNDCIVQFADSSSIAWSNQATFLILNWNGSPTGAGQHQLIFGSSAASLTPQQVSQIQFLNPAGATGIFPARILPTGEIVPDRSLAVHKSSTELLIEWTSGTLQSATNVSGPYQDVSGATSPYATPFTNPAQFFRLGQ